MFSSFQNLEEERNTGLHSAGLKLFSTLDAWALGICCLLLLLFLTLMIVPLKCLKKADLKLSHCYDKMGRSFPAFGAGKKQL